MPNVAAPGNRSAGWAQGHFRGYALYSRRRVADDVKFMLNYMQPAQPIGAAERPAGRAAAGSAALNDPITGALAHLFCGLTKAGYTVLCR